MQELIKQIEIRLDVIRCMRKNEYNFFEVKIELAAAEAELEWVLGKLYELDDKS